MKYTQANKPSVSPEARKRIRLFVREIATLQKRLRVDIHTQDGMLTFTDRKRRASPDYDFDAYIAEDFALNERNLAFEDFSWWGQ